MLTNTLVIILARFVTQSSVHDFVVFALQRCRLAELDLLGARAEEHFSLQTIVSADIVHIRLAKRRCGDIVVALERPESISTLREVKVSTFLATIAVGKLRTTIVGENHTQSVGVSAKESIVPPSVWTNRMAIETESFHPFGAFVIAQGSDLFLVVWALANDLSNASAIGVQPAKVVTIAVGQIARTTKGAGEFGCNIEGRS